jgi:lipid II:glycine glycyltransferase (peptidoglycan interpeptide bridge formation enzyme)
LVQQTHAVEDVQKQVSGYQLDLEDAITSREEQLTALHCEIQKLRDMIVENGEEHTTQLKQLEEDRKALGESRKLLEELLAECHETVFQAASESHARTTTVTFGSHNSGFQSGIINGGVSGLTFGAR